MGEFFSGWRRKVGGVALMSASVLMMLWTRSYSVCDSIIVQDSAFSADSLLGSISWGWTYRYEVPGPAIEWLANDIRKLRPEYLTAEYRLPNELSYWAIVMPLTLLSAYLLLGKSRPPKPVPAKLAESR